LVSSGRLRTESTLAVAETSLVQTTEVVSIVSQGVTLAAGLQQWGTDTPLANLSANTETVGVLSCLVAVAALWETLAVYTLLISVTELVWVEGVGVTLAALQQALTLCANLISGTEVVSVR